jgi:membrane fusion protein, multidrug efflux system
VVQRLPVRIELEGYDPDKTPLFIGTSVVPYVYIDEPATGPDAGKLLQARMVPPSQTAGTLQRAPGAGR